METPVLLQTKLQPTLMGFRSLNRARLLRELEREPNPRLILVSGPAGSGKSTLMADFVAQRTRPAAWLSLGEEDADPLMFFSYFLESLCQTFPGSAEQSRNALQTLVDDPVALGSMLINELVKYKEPVAIVLDDYHLIPKHDFLTHLLKRGPANLTIMLASRDLPNELPLPWLRAKRMMVELQQDNLRFTQDETAALFQEIWGQTLEHDLVKILVEKTEGWATGLQLVAQAVRGKPAGDVRRYVESLQGRDESIYTYLATEVFEAQPPEVREFLELTSVPDSFNPALAQVLAPDLNAQHMLQQVRLARLFLIQLDREGEWFRYHHLFRDFLRAQLNARRGRVAVETLHYKTARWLQNHDDIVASVPHYLVAGDPTLAAEILESAGSELLHRGLKASVVRWLEELPANLRHSRPGLQTLQAELWDLQGQWSKAVEGYQTALQEYKVRKDARQTAAVLEKLSLCYIKYGDTTKLMETCEEGLKTCSDDLPLRSMLQSWMGATLITNGQNWPRAYELIKEAHSIAWECQDPRAISWACLTYGFGYHFPQGNFAEALRSLNEGIDYFSRLGWPMVLYQLSMNKALVLLSQGDAQGAAEVLDETLIQARRAGHTYVTKGLELLRGWAYLERCQLKEARETLSAVAQSEIPAQMKPAFFRNRMVLHCLEGNYDQAHVDAEEMERILLLQGSGMYAMECFLSQGYMLCREGEYTEAEHKLELARKLSRQASAKFWEMKSHELLAWLNHLRQDEPRMLKHLGKALELTEANDYHAHWLLDSWGICLPLLFRALAANLHVDWVERFLARTDGSWMQEAPEMLKDPSSALRLAVVRALGRSSREQARNLLKEVMRQESDPAIAAEARKLLRLPQYQNNLHIACLGPLRVYRDGELLDHSSWLRPMAVRLLMFFLVHADKFVPTDLILETFWPDVQPEKARHSLHNQLTQLRRFLGCPTALQRQGENYRLFGEGEASIDVLEFEKSYSQGMDALKRGESTKAVELLLEAEGQYKGRFLEEDLYEDWIEQPRRELSRKFEHLNETLGDLFFQSKRYEQALARYRRLLEQSDLQERFFHKAFQCYEALGDRQGARRDYELFRARLRELLGLEPQPATRALVESLFLKN